MKNPRTLLVVSGCVMAEVLAYGASSALRLQGIVSLPDQKLAVFAVAPSQPGQARHRVLGEGQREGDLEVIRIDIEAAAVEARVGRTNEVVTLKFESQTNRIGGAGPGFVLDQAELNPVLRIYSLLTGRTLLRSPRLPVISMSIGGSATNLAGVARLLEQALRDKHITSIPDGDKFLMVVTEAEAAAVRPRSSEIKSQASAGNRGEMLPAGSINFSGTDLNQVVAIYAELIGRKLETTPRPNVPASVVNFSTQTGLNREECVYALETIFEWHGVKVIPVGKDSARLVRVQEAGVGAGR